MSAARRTGAGAAALAAGFLLSFLGVGLLWIAMAWVVQGLMLLPFAACSYALGRWSGRPRDSGFLLFLGMLPLGALLTQFRDRQGSHLAPVLVVALWVAGIVLGTWLAQRRASTAR